MSAALDTSPASPDRFAMRGIRKAFGGTVAVDAVDFAVGPGEVCALVGENGAGKSTLMAILAGALQPDAGAMMLDDRRYRPLSPLEARQLGVTMIYQELSIAPHLSVMENVALGVEPEVFGFVDRRAMREQALAALDELGHPHLSPHIEAGRLSIAEQQIVEIARALVGGCRVLVLDEPTSSLGRDDVAHLFALIDRLKRQGIAIVYISHFIEEVKAVADRVVVLRDGRVAGEGAVEDLSTREIVRLMVGRGIEDLYPRSPRERGDALLEVEALEPGDASFTVHRGEIFGIAGLVGAGRTRLLRSIFGLEPVRSGLIRVGVHSGAASPRARWRQGMGMLSEDRKGEGLALDLSIADNITMSRLEGLGPGALVMPFRQRSVAERWMERIGIRARSPKQRAHELSGGNQQKLAFARLLHHDVDLLVLDEPTRGIDVGSKAQLYALIDQLVSGAAGPAGAGASRPRAVLMVSSYLPELLGICDTIAVMQRGRLGRARPAAAWTEHDLMLAATGTDASGGPSAGASATPEGPATGGGAA